MKSKTKVVVIGGGAVGVSMLYHLAKKGWSDVVLVERKELTSGSTWHAAGLLPLFNMSYSVGQLHKYAVNLYKTLEEETGKSVGFSVVSNIRLAQTEDRMDEYHQYAELIKPGLSFKEFVKKSWKLPEPYYGNRYSCMVHGIGLCDEWPMIKYPTDGGQQSGQFEKDMTVTVESYIGEVGGKEGVKLEQQYLVGENGLELMSHHPLEDV